jgi:hypothetical protein
VVEVLVLLLLLVQILKLQVQIQYSQQLHQQVVVEAVQVMLLLHP